MEIEGRNDNGRGILSIGVPTLLVLHSFSWKSLHLSVTISVVHRRRHCPPVALLIAFPGGNRGGSSTITNIAQEGL